MSSTKLRVKALLKERGWTTKVLAEKTGMSESYLTHIKNATRRWNEDALQKLADAFNVDPIEIFDHTLKSSPDFLPALSLAIPQGNNNGPKDPVMMVPVVGEIPAQPSAFNNAMIQAETGYSNRYLPVCWHDTTTPIFALHIRESSFAPRFDKGDYLIIVPTDKINAGDIVALEYGNDELTRTVMQINFTDTIIVLESLNQSRGPIALVKGKDHCRIIGKVIFRYQKIAGASAQ